VGKDLFYLVRAGQRGYSHFVALLMGLRGLIRVRAVPKIVPVRAPVLAHPLQDLLYPQAAQTARSTRVDEEIPAIKEARIAQEVPNLEPVLLEHQLPA